jgi:hypothetical protein
MGANAKDVREKMWMRGIMLARIIYMMSNQSMNVSEAEISKRTCSTINS